MANRFWVGGGSANTWAATANTNWATTSGGAFNASVPTTTDVAIFDSNSGVGNSVISSSTAVQGLDCTGGTGNYAGTITHNTSITLTINTGAATSLRFSSGMTYTPATVTSSVTFTNTSGTAQLTSAGKAFGSITINGAGGTVQQQDDLSINAVSTNSATFTITNGIFDCNGHALTVSNLSSNNANARSLILGGTVTLGGNSAANANVWNTSNTTGLTFTKNSANIVILAPNPNAITGWNFIAGSLAFNGLTINSSTVGSLLQITTPMTVSSLSIGSGWTIQLSSSTLTVGSAFTLAGTQSRPICLGALSPNGQPTISCSSGACSLTWGALQGIVGTGGATFTATNTLDFGQNTGWAITPPADSSSTGIAAAVWQDATAGDFTVSGSIGKSLFTSGNVPGSASGLFIAGTNAATSITTALTANVTGNITGNLSGSVGSVTGAVGSVAGNVSGSVASVVGAVGSVAGNVVGSVGSVAGNVTGSVGSVTSRVTANTDQIAGNATSATNLSLSTLVIGRGTVGSGSTTTSVVTSTYSIAGKSGPRSIVFDPATTTTNLRGQGVAITSSTGGATPTFTVATLTDAPVSGDTFSVL